MNWHTTNIPDGTPAGGFVPYLHLTAKVTNQTTGLSSFIDLLPHINLIDNFHYARNVSLPGNIDDFYTVEFSVTKPASNELSLHRDWLDNQGEELMENQIFIYKDVDFEAIAKASKN